MENLKPEICCFFGHREITVTDELVLKLSTEIEKLIAINNVHTFLFGSNSRFDELCYMVVSKLKEKHTHIKRVYVRAAYADIDNRYEKYLLQRYEESYYPQSIRGAGKASYVERNREMINNSTFCIVYHDENYLPPRRKGNSKNLTDYQPKSGTKLAFEYARRKNKIIMNVYDLLC